MQDVSDDPDQERISGGPLREKTEIVLPVPQLERCDRLKRSQPEPLLKTLDGE
ncbi:MAG: hypothetical protein IH987_18550 [Planctomycetes bacterium]|nr:hypothetical protein [Planctomycetota bacterium]